MEQVIDVVELRNKRDDYQKHIDTIDQVLLLIEKITPAEPAPRPGAGLAAVPVRTQESLPLPLVEAVVPRETRRKEAERAIGIRKAMILALSTGSACCTELARACDFDVSKTADALRNLIDDRLAYENTSREPHRWTLSMTGVFIAGWYGREENRRMKKFQPNEADAAKFELLKLEQMRYDLDRIGAAKK